MRGWLQSSLHIKRWCKSHKTCPSRRLSRMEARKMKSLLNGWWPKAERAFHPQAAAHEVPCASNRRHTSWKIYPSVRSWLHWVRKRWEVFWLGDGPWYGEHLNHEWLHAKGCTSNSQCKSQKTCPLGRSYSYRVWKDKESPDWAMTYSGENFTITSNFPQSALCIKHTV